MATSSVRVIKSMPTFLVLNAQYDNARRLSTKLAALDKMRNAKCYDHR